MGDVMDGKSSAERMVILQKAMHDDTCRKAGAEVLDLLRALEMSRKATAERKKAYDEAVVELVRLTQSTPPKPDPQMKLPFTDVSESIDALSLPGEVHDLLMDAGIDSMVEVSQLIRGEHDDYSAVEDIQGMSEVQAAIVREAYAKLDAEVTAENSDDAGDDDDDAVVEGESPVVSAPKAAPEEPEYEDVDDADRVKVRLKEEIDDCPIAKGEVVDGRKLPDDNVLAFSKGGEDYLLTAGEYEYV